MDNKKNAIFEYWNDWFSEHEMYDEYNTVVKLNRSEFMAIIQQIIDGIAITD